MTIASLLLALTAAAATPASDSTAQAVLLDFHAEWCGPCHKARPAVQQLIRDGFPIKTVDIDQSPELARRYHVDSVPTFIVADAQGRELDRTSGPQSAAALARFYKTAAAKAQPPVSSNAHVGEQQDSREGGSDDEPPADADAKNRPEQEPESTPGAFANPKPWETVVRIRVIGNRSVGFGSGTIVYSSPEESLILTCAHIFKLDGRKQAAPAQFPRRIMIDLFDGVLQGTDPARVHFLEQVEGKAVDYDFTRDVGLIRIQPGRRLPASRVVPAHWEPQARMKVLAVGCSEGNDATAWHTVIKRPRLQNFLSGNPSYEAVECDWAPKQGRSGGGLYTLDGYLAGVCNFAEPQGNHGLYATPRSIYQLLDRNSLTALYAPARRGSDLLLAGRRPGKATRRSEDAPVSVARSQSPDGEEPPASRNLAKNGGVMIPSPGLMGIPDPVASQTERSPQAASGTTRRTAWHLTPDPVSAAKDRNSQRAMPTDLNLDPAADHDHFTREPEKPRSERPEVNAEDATPTSPSVGPSKTRWRPVKAGPTAPAS